MKRSKGVTAFCILFGLFTLAGLGDSIVILSGTVEVVPTWLGYLTLVFGITAGGAATGLWRMNRWGLFALRCWFVACLLLIFAAAFAFYSTIPGGITLVLIIVAIVIGVCLALDRFIASKFEYETNRDTGI